MTGKNVQGPPKVEKKADQANIGSFVEEPRVEPTKPPSKDGKKGNAQPNAESEQKAYPLFTKLDTIAELMKEGNELTKANTEATNALITTLVSQVRPQLVQPEQKEKRRILKEVREAPAPNEPEPKAPDRKIVEPPINRFNKPSVEPKTPPHAPKEETPLPEAEPQPSAEDWLDNCKNLFPKGLKDQLLFTNEGEFIRVKPRQYLGSDSFAKIASIVREMCGEYISAGRDSHFRLYQPK